MPLNLANTSAIPVTQETNVSLNRRELLISGAAGLALSADNAQAAPSRFHFVHITDTHIQPELGATSGVHRAFQAVKALEHKPGFGLIGGDLVMDASRVSHDRADRVFALWREQAETLGMPLHYSMGNHDLYGLGSEAEGKPSTDSPDYGKKLWKKRLGLSTTYSTFDHQGWRFVSLDSAGITPDYGWEGVLDLAQISWLDNLLRKTPRTMPMVFLTHYPIFTAFTQYYDGPEKGPTSGMVVKNGKQFREMIQKHNVKAVFQGHSHIVEEIEYLGVKYITGGAVCGEWWKGPRLGVHPEGFVSVTVEGQNLHWKYVPYGWNAAQHASA